VSLRGGYSIGIYTDAGFSSLGYGSQRHLEILVHVLWLDLSEFGLYKGFSDYYHYSLDIQSRLKPAPLLMGGTYLSNNCIHRLEQK
jgi:hypothetical protein